MEKRINGVESSAIAFEAEQVCAVDVVEGDAPIIRLSGEIDIGSAPRVYSLMWQTAERGKRPLVVDLGSLEFMDSSGLQVLLRLREKLRVQGKKILLVSPRPQIKKLFKLTGFDKLFPVFDSNTQAVSFLRLEGEVAPSSNPA